MANGRGKGYHNDTPSKRAKARLRRLVAKSEQIKLLPLPKKRPGDDAKSESEAGKEK